MPTTLDIETVSSLIETATQASLEYILPVWILMTSVFIAFAVARSLVFLIKKMV